MTAIPKALAMANPKHVVAFVATAAGVISSKFAIDAVSNEIDDTDIDNKRPDDTLANYEIEEIEDRKIEVMKVCGYDFYECTQSDKTKE